MSNGLQRRIHRAATTPGQVVHVGLQTLVEQFEASGVAERTLALSERCGEPQRRLTGFCCVWKAPGYVLALPTIAWCDDHALWRSGVP